MTALRYLLAWLLVATPVMYMAIAQEPTLATSCPYELLVHWNKFAPDANAYALELRDGKYDLRLKARVMREWAALTGLACW